MRLFFLLVPLFLVLNSFAQETQSNATKDSLLDEPILADIKKALAVLPEKVFVSYALSYLMDQGLRWTVGENQYQDWVGDQNSYAQKLTDFTSVVLMGPIYEELKYRLPMVPLLWALGADHPVLKGLAKLANGIIFGSAHLKNNHPEKIRQALYTGISGLYYCNLVEQAESVLAPNALAHMANNFLAYSLLGSDSTTFYGLTALLGGITLFNHRETVVEYFKHFIGEAE